MRKTSLSYMKRNQQILEDIRKIKMDHPFWGYRRIWAYLTYVEKKIVNKKRVYTLMKKSSLLVTKDVKLKAKRTLRPKPKPQKPNQIWGTDMTKIKIEKLGWVYLVIVLDWFTKKIVGYTLETRSTTQEWLQALDNAVNKQFPRGVREEKLKLVSDNGCQPTSKKYMKSCHLMEIQQIFTSYNNPKGNADTERMIRTIKEELFWIKEWNNFYQMQQAVDSWVDDYNKNYLHSALGYKSPMSVEKTYRKKVA